MDIREYTGIPSSADRGAQREPRPLLSLSVVTAFAVAVPRHGAGITPTAKIGAAARRGWNRRRAGQGSGLVTVLARHRMPERRETAALVDVAATVVVAEHADAGRRWRCSVAVVVGAVVAGSGHTPKEESIDDENVDRCHRPRNHGDVRGGQRQEDIGSLLAATGLDFRRRRLILLPLLLEAKVSIGPDRRQRQLFRKPRRGVSR